MIAPTLSTSFVASHTSWRRAVKSEQRAIAKRRRELRLRYAGYGIAAASLTIIALLEPVSRAV